MKYLSIIIVMIAVLFSVFGCNLNDTSEPEKEPAKNIIGLVSENNENIVGFVHDLSASDAEGWTEGFISAQVSGVIDATNPITFSLTEYPALLDSYNKSNFGTDANRYAKLISANGYSISNPFSFPNPEKDKVLLMKLRVRTGVLSPDFSYFIPLKIGSASAYELDLKKNTLLYQVYVENKWASTRSIPKYQHNGLRMSIPNDGNVFIVEGINPWSSSSLVKELFPISDNVVRTLAGNKTIAANDNRESVYEKWAMRISVATNGSLTITPWGNSSTALIIEQLDGDPEYPNQYKLMVDEESGITYLTFLLNYKYYDPDAKIFYWMKERLRIEQEFQK